MLACTEGPSDSLPGVVAEPLSRAGSPAAVLEDAPEAPSAPSCDGKSASVAAFTDHSLPSRGPRLQVLLEPQPAPSVLAQPPCCAAAAAESAGASPPTSTQQVGSPAAPPERPVPEQGLSPRALSSKQELPDPMPKSQSADMFLHPLALHWSSQFTLVQFGRGYCLQAIPYVLFVHGACMLHHTPYVFNRDQHNCIMNNNKLTRLILLGIYCIDGSLLDLTWAVLLKT